MRFRLSFAVVSFVLFAVAACYSQFDSPMRRGLTQVEGKVHNADGTPRNGVSVELHQLTSGATTAITLTGPDGSFAMYNIPAGEYEIVAHDTQSETRQHLDVDFAAPTVDLRFNDTVASDAGDRNTVSVSEMRVPGKARNSFNKARDAFANSNYDEALKQVGKALSVYPQFAEALTLQGLLLIQKNQLDQGKKDFESAIQCDPTYGLAYVALGTALNKSGQYDDASRTLERGVSLSPNSWQGYFEMSRAYLGKGMYQKALQLAEKAQSLAPRNFAPIHLLKAYAMIPQKLYKDAKSELQAFLSDKPGGQSAEQAQKLLAQVEAAETVIEGQ